MCTVVNQHQRTVCIFDVIIFLCNCTEVTNKSLSSAAHDVRIQTQIHFVAILEKLESSVGFLLHVWNTLIL